VRISARAAAQPLKAGAIGLLAQLLFLPLLIVTIVLLVVTIIGIPLLVLIPFVLLGLVAVPLLGRRWRRRLAGAFFAMVYVAWFTTLHTFRRLDVVTLREWAGDPLFYESQARSILDSWSLAGGEPVFIYQPLYRYIRFAQRLLLGEGDGLVSMLALAALWWALCWTVARLWARPRPGWPRTILFGSAALLLLALASTSPVVFFIQVSLSEYPTWIFLALLLPMLFASQSPTHWRSGVVLASLSMLTRSNQAPGVLALLGAFDHPGLRGRYEGLELSVRFGPRRLTVAMASGLLRSIPTTARFAPRQASMIRMPSCTRSGYSTMVR